MKHASSFATAAHIGAVQRGGAVSRATAASIARVAESVVVELRQLTEARIREIVRNDLLTGRHPSWYNAPFDEGAWRKFLLDAVVHVIEYGEELDLPRAQLRVLEGGKS